MVFIKLKTFDQIDVTVERTIIRKSKTIMHILDDLILMQYPDASAQDLVALRLTYENPEPIQLESINKDTFDNVLIWCQNHKDESEHLDDDELKNHEKIMVVPEKDQELFKSLKNRELLDLLKAANFLDIAKLKLNIAITLRDKIRGEGPEEIRRIFSAV